jgi:hypothetical protein
MRACCSGEGRTANSTKLGSDDRASGSNRATPAECCIGDDHCIGRRRNICAKWPATTIIQIPLPPLRHPHLHRHIYTARHGLETRRRQAALRHRARLQGQQRLPQRPQDFRDHHHTAQGARGRRERPAQPPTRTERPPGQAGPRARHQQRRQDRQPRHCPAPVRSIPALMHAQICPAVCFSPAAILMLHALTHIAGSLSGRMS